MRTASVFEISYEMTTYQWYEYDFDSLTELDLAHTNPSSEKQRVHMLLMPNGQMNMSVEKMAHARRNIIPHRTLPNDILEVHRTVIMGNTVSFYDVNGRQLGAQTIDLPSQIELVEQIRELGNEFGDKEVAQAITTMQGGFLERNFEKMIADAQTRNQLIEHCERYATLRVNFSDVAPGTKGASVLLFDRDRQKMVASSTYDENENLTQRMYLEYAKEGPQVLVAKRAEQRLQLPSGAEAWKISHTVIENKRISINPQKNNRNEN